MHFEACNLIRAVHPSYNTIFPDAFMPRDRPGAGPKEAGVV